MIEFKEIRIEKNIVEIPRNDSVTTLYGGTWCGVHCTEGGVCGVGCRDNYGNNCGVWCQVRVFM